MDEAAIIYKVRRLPGRRIFYIHPPLPKAWTYKPTHGGYPG